MDTAFVQIRKKKENIAHAKTKTKEQSHSKPQMNKRQCFSRRTLIRNVISVIYSMFVYKSVTANCCWSLVRFDEKSLSESFIQYVNISPVLYNALPKQEVILQHFSQKHDAESRLDRRLFVHEQVAFMEQWTKHTRYKQKNILSVYQCLFL